MILRQVCTVYSFFPRLSGAVGDGSMKLLKSFAFHFPSSHTNSTTPNSLTLHSTPSSFPLKPTTHVDSYMRVRVPPNFTTSQATSPSCLYSRSLTLRERRVSVTASADAAGMPLKMKVAAEVNNLVIRLASPEKESMISRKSGRKRKPGEGVEGID